MSWICPTCGAERSDYDSEGVWITECSCGYERPIQENPNLFQECHTCNKSISKRAVICPHCSTKQTRSCAICQSQISVDSSICIECGDPFPFGKQNSSQTTENVAQPTTTAIPQKSVNQRKQLALDSAKKSAKYTCLFFLIIIIGRAVPHVLSGVAPNPTWLDYFLLNFILAIIIIPLFSGIVWLYKIITLK